MKFSSLLLINILILCITYLVSAEVSECGKPNEESNRIVHGRDVGYLKYPWFATLLLASNKDRLMCGGSLVGPRHVLTAAHCFKPFLSKAKEGVLALENIYHIKLGVNNICEAETTQQKFNVTKVHIHEQYEELMPYYDIALLELDRNTNYTPICLPQVVYNDTNRRTDAIIVGLGKESVKAWRLPCTVKEARVLVWNETVCKNMLESMNEDSSKFTNAFCAGYLEGEIDSCQGDSGGPLQTYNQSSNTYELDGITSFGFGCASPGVLGVYTDVSHYTDWIQGKILQDQLMADIASKQENKTNSYPIFDKEVKQKVVTTTSPRPVHKKHHRRRPSWTDILNW